MAALIVASTVQLTDGTFSEAIGVPVVGVTLQSTGMDASLDENGADLTELAREGEAAKAARTPPPALPPAPPPPEEATLRRAVSAGAATGVAVAVMLGIGALAGLLYVVCKRRSRSVRPQAQWAGDTAGHSAGNTGVFATLTRVFSNQERLRQTSSVPGTTVDIAGRATAEETAAPDGGDGRTNGQAKVCRPRG